VVRALRTPAGHLTLRCCEDVQASHSTCVAREFDFESDVRFACAAHSHSVPPPARFSGVPATAPRGRLRVPTRDMSSEDIDRCARWVHVRWGHCGLEETNRRLSLGVFSDAMKSKANVG
jgi:hypothetical protein